MEVPIVHVNPALVPVRAEMEGIGRQDGVNVSIFWPVPSFEGAFTARGALALASWSFFTASHLLPAVRAPRERMRRPVAAPLPAAK